MAEITASRPMDTKRGKSKVNGYEGLRKEVKSPMGQHGRNNN